MNLSEIKAQLGVQTLPMTRQTEADGTTPSKWLTNWDDTNRVRVVIHEDLLGDIHNEGALFLKSSQETSQVSQKPYTQHIICRGASVEVVL